ncbi:MAG: hypothetical protein M3R06_10690, partial [Chloroflexota bacterium]|nr:hypothetical protein [Chloroflexota bacterium]
MKDKPMPPGSSAPSKKSARRPQVTLTDAESTAERLRESTVTDAKPATAPSAAPTKKPRGARRVADRPRVRPIALPVLVVDETLLLPHM